MVDPEKKAGEDGWKSLAEILKEGEIEERKEGHPADCPCCSMPSNEGIEAFREKLRLSLGRRGR